MTDYKEYINETPNFPVEGINFKDISPLLANKEVFKQAVKDMGNLVCETWLDVPEYWIAVDARGFLFAGALSYAFGGGIVMCRKAGKLPGFTLNHFYQTEYSSDEISLQRGSGKVIIVDDVLATGGTLQSVNFLSESAGYEVVGNVVLVDLQYVPRVKESILGEFDLEVKSLIQYE